MSRSSEKGLCCQALHRRTCQARRNLGPHPHGSHKCKGNGSSLGRRRRPHRLSHLRQQPKDPLTPPKRTGPSFTHEATSRLRSRPDLPRAENGKSRLKQHVIKRSRLCFNSAILPTETSTANRPSNCRVSGFVQSLVLVLPGCRNFWTWWYCPARADEK